MGWVILYLVLGSAFVASLFFPSAGHFSISTLVKDIAGCGAAVGAFTQALARVHLRTYLALQRIKIWWFRDRTTHWRFALRLDGMSDEDPIGSVASGLNTYLAKWHPKILNSNSRSALILIDRTIHLQLSFVPNEESEDGDSHLLIESHELEVSYGNATRKLDSTIIPVMGAFTSLLRPEQSSTMFTVSFSKPNPFFGFYVEHLKASDIAHFNLVFHPHLSHGDEADRVTVTANSVEVAAGTTDAFCRLVKAFLLLTSEAITLTEG